MGTECREGRLDYLGNLDFLYRSWEHRLESLFVPHSSQSHFSAYLFGSWDAFSHSVLSVDGKHMGECESVCMGVGGGGESMDESSLCA